MDSYRGRQINNRGVNAPSININIALNGYDKKDANLKPNEPIKKGTLASEVALEDFADDDRDLTVEKRAQVLREEAEKKRRENQEVDLHEVDIMIEELDPSTLNVDVNALLEKFNSGALTKMEEGDTLYNYYSKEDVEERIRNIKEFNSGRDAAIECALSVIYMAAEVGKKLDYDFGGGHGTITTLDDVASGVDCSAFASWAINQGSVDEFYTRATGGLLQTGTTIDYQDAQKGDILVYDKAGNGHVVMIVENDPVNKTFVVAEAEGSNTGVVLHSKSYSDFAGVYYAKDLSSIYGE